jgi:hypothetical protein
LATSPSAQHVFFHVFSFAGSAGNAWAVFLARHPAAMSDRSLGSRLSLVVRSAKQLTFQEFCEESARVGPQGPQTVRFHGWVDVIEFQVFLAAADLAFTAKVCDSSFSDILVTKKLIRATRIRIKLCQCAPPGS